MVLFDKYVDAKVLMVGPDLSLHGGIVSVVEGYLGYGLPGACEGFEYLGTGTGSSKFAKTAAFARVLARYTRILPGYDIVHLHISARGSYKRKSIMTHMARKAGKYIVLHEHDGEFAKTFEGSDESYRRNVRETFGAADRVIVLSEEWRDFFAESVCDAEKIVVVHNGVSVPADPCDPCAHQNILFLGRLDARKSPDVLLRAAKSVLKRFPDVRMIFGGDGAIEKYKRLAEELGIEKNCEFHGWVSEADRETLFARAGVYCLPSKNEGLPMSVLEAMARGIPTVATAVGGVPRVIEDGESGILVDVDNVEGLSAGLCFLLGSKETRAMIGLAGRRRIQQEFTVNKSSGKILDVYRSLLNEGECDG